MLNLNAMYIVGTQETLLNVQLNIDCSEEKISWEQVYLIPPSKIQFSSTSIASILENQWLNLGIMKKAK